jgi:hypothetical protein
MFGLCYIIYFMYEPILQYSRKYYILHWLHKPASYPKVDVFYLTASEFEYVLMQICSRIWKLPSEGIGDSWKKPKSRKISFSVDLSYYTPKIIKIIL